jgi:hypothetical protein
MSCVKSYVFQANGQRQKTVTSLFALEPGVNQKENVQNANTTALGRLRNMLTSVKIKRWERSMGLIGVPKYDDHPSEMSARVHPSP